MEYVCAHCHSPISSRQESMVTLSDGGKSSSQLVYHAHCAVCSLCRLPMRAAEPILTSADGLRRMHVQCWDSMEAPTCWRCQLRIRGTETAIVWQDGSKLHARCFTCSHCQLPIEDSKFSRDPTKPESKDLYHTQCFRDRFAPRCRACKEPVSIGRPYIHLNGDGGPQSLAFHEECFRCWQCKSILAKTGAYKGPENAPDRFLCTDCFRLECLKQAADTVSSPAPSLIRTQPTSSPSDVHCRSNHRALPTGFTGKDQVESKTISSRAISDDNTKSSTKSSSLIGNEHTNQGLHFEDSTVLPNSQKLSQAKEDVRPPTPPEEPPVRPNAVPGSMDDFSKAIDVPFIASADTFTPSCPTLTPPPPPPLPQVEVQSNAQPAGKCADPKDGRSPLPEHTARSSLLSAIRMASLRDLKKVATPVRKDQAGTPGHGSSGWSGMAAEIQQAIARNRSQLSYDDGEQSDLDLDW